jgi:hypothetical protein
MPAAVARYPRFAHVVPGAVTAAWGVTLTFVVRNPFAARERWAWNAAALAVALWFVLDSGASAWLGVWPNVVLNAASVAPFVIALAATRRAFAK